MRVTAMATLVLVAGCGGGGGGGGDSGGSGIDPRLSRIDIYEAQRIRVLGDPGAGVMGMAETPDVSMPITGSAAFTGSMTVRAETSPGPATLAGDATVNMDFDVNEISGSATRFFGTDPDGVLRNFAGNVTIDQGTIGGDTPNAWQLDYAGVLTGGGQSVVLDGRVTGSFLGDPVAAIAGVEVEAAVIYDGVLAEGIVTVIAEGEVPSED